MVPAFGRRGVVAALAATVLARRGEAMPTAFPESVSLLVAGPAGGTADRWAQLIAPPLARGLRQGGSAASGEGPSLRRQDVGGADGVTGANQFEANAAPDGSTALVTPGMTALAWLAGGTRVRFDAAHWVPIWACTVSAAVASRVPLMPGQRVRYALGNAMGPELAGLYALELLGVEVTPVPSDGEADVVFLRGAALRDAMAGQRGMAPAFGFGSISAAGEMVRDVYRELPTAREFVLQARPETPGTAIAGLEAMAASAQLEMALTLPRLSPAAIVAWWRRAATALNQSAGLQAEAARTGVRSADGLGFCAIAGDAAALLELRRWFDRTARRLPA